MLASLCPLLHQMSSSHSKAIHHYSIHDGRSHYSEDNFDKYQFRQLLLSLAAQSTCLVMEVLGVEENSTAADHCPRALDLTTSLPCRKKMTQLCDVGKNAKIQRSLSTSVMISDYNRRRNYLCPEKTKHNDLNLS